jgi:hypothetical protein
MVMAVIFFMVASSMQSCRGERIEDTDDPLSGNVESDARKKIIERLNEEDGPTHIIVRDDLAEQEPVMISIQEQRKAIFYDICIGRGESEERCLEIWNTDENFLYFDEGEMPSN